MKVVFVTPGLGLGGAERWILTLCQYLPEEIEVAGIYVCHRQYHPFMVREARKLGVPLLVPTERVNCNAVITWGVPNVRQILGPTTVPIIEVSHNTPMLKEQVPYLHQACWNATHWVAVSDAAKESFPGNYRNRVAVIENGVDLERCRSGRGPNYRALWGVADDEYVVLQLGRLDIAKAPYRLIEAARYLPSNWVPVFVGDGPLRDECVQLARATGRRMVFESPTDDVGSVYAAAECLCMPSDTEGLPLVMLEAFLAELPVVATAFNSAVDMQRRYGPEPMMVLVPLPAGAYTHDDARKLAAAIEGSLDFNCGHPLRVAEVAYTARAMAARWTQFLRDVVHAPRGDFVELSA